MSATYGRRLMPTILRQEARHNPERVFAIYAQSDDLADGFESITFRQMAAAVDHVSNWLQSHFEDGAQPPKFDTLTYIGVPDIRYNILFYAATQCRYKVFLPSPRNPVAVNLALCQQTECTKVVHSAEVASVARAMLAANSRLHIEQLASLQELLAEPVSKYPYDFDYGEVKDDPILILHSSGSTGLPKPVVHTHGTFATYDIRDWPTVPGRRTQDGLGMLTFSDPDSSTYDVFPPFHIAGFMTKLMVPVYNLTIPIFGPPSRPPSGALAAEIIRQHRPRGVLLPPSIAEQLYHEPGGTELLSGVDVLFFAGGPLSQVVGDEIAKYTTLCQYYGSTEAGLIRQLVPLPGEWPYMHFNPHESFEMQPAGEGLSELVIFTGKHLERSSSLYHNFPSVREWRTKDLFEPHPDKPGLWKFYARTDDILVFSSGEKLNPVIMETYLSSVDGVAGALVVGKGERQAALLVEFGGNADPNLDPCHYLWPFVERGNAQLPAHGRIAKSMIIIADPNKPFARAGKGTIVRRLTEQLYRDEIRGLFEETSNDGLAPAVSFKPSTFSEKDVKDLIRAILRATAVVGDIGDRDNLYIHGVDSVKTVEILSQLKASLRPYRSTTDLKWLSPEVLYRNPSIEQLCQTLLDFLNHGNAEMRRDRKADIETTIQQYTDLSVEGLTACNDFVHSDTFCIAVTGTTGYFGSFLLHELARDAGVSKIFCLNRSASAQENFERHYPGCSERIQFFQVKMTSPDLGLAPGEYSQLRQSCNAILHNAWRVDFNLSLASFEENLSSIPPLIRLSATGAHRPRIFYVSSVSATGVWAPEGHPQITVPESVVPNPDAPMPLGYAESKYVAERVVQTAANRLGLPATILRVGQLSPSSRPEDRDTWPDGDIMRVYLRTCRTLGAVASDFVGTMDWVCVDQLAAVVADVLRADTGIAALKAATTRVYNLVHPRPRDWATVVEDPVRTWCGPDTRVVRMQEWVGLARNADDGRSATLARFPALRMLHVYDLMAAHRQQHAYDVRGLESVSKSMARLSAADGELMSMWLDRL